jgi:CubicO group peptidase (beta-lactamase class C family)
MVHHLLTHTSGLVDSELDEYARARITAGELVPPEPAPGIGPTALLAMRTFEGLLAAPLSQPAGAAMSYSSYGFRLLTEIAARVAPQPLERFVQDRILSPLGMMGSSYAGLPVSRRDRLVRRPDSAPFANANCPDHMARIGWGHASAYATALDLAVFTQLFLNGGSYGAARVLSRASAREMTRNQIAGTPANFRGGFFPEASWGLGWGIHGNKKSVREGSLLSPSAFNHTGAAMMHIWADPTLDLLGVYLSVELKSSSTQWTNWNADLFANAATAAIDD